MANKTLIIGGIGILVLGAALAIYLAFAGSDATVDPGSKTTIEKTTPKVEDQRPVAVADNNSAKSERNVVNTNNTAPLDSKSGIEGTVTSAAGSAIVGARVEIKKIPMSFTFGANPVIAAKLRQSDMQKAESYSGLSGADGKFRIVATPGDGWTLIATHSEYARVEHTNISIPPDGFYAFAVQMAGGCRVYGRVTEHEKNMPVMGATVVMDGDPGTTGFGASMNDKRETQTDNSGTFKFENVGTGTHSFTIKALTYGTKNFPRISIPNDQPYRLDAMLMPGFNISGHVVDASGHPVPNAHVRASASGGVAAPNEAVTNENGEFVITDLEEGRYFVDADAGDLGSGKPDSQTPIASGTVDVEIRLAARAGVAGIVRDKATGQPVKNFTIDVRRGVPGNALLRHEIGPFTFKDRRDGSFEILGMDPQGQHLLCVTSDGYALAISDSFTVQPGQTTRGVDVAVITGGILKGVVLDNKTGQPVANATVQLRDNNYKDIGQAPALFGLLMGGPNDQKGSNINVQSDAEGRFAMQHVEEGIHKLQVTHPRFTTFFLSDISISNGQTRENLVARLLSGARVSGTVRNADGTPAGNAEVSVQKSGGFVPGGGLFNKKIRTDANGKYSVAGIPAGDYTIVAVPVNSGNNPFIGAIYNKYRKPISCSEGIDQDGIDFDLPKANQ
ncbi:MAG: carboxypeptidase regulatory-like domain-containing protein [Planctomycetes bacterium]|nr:carboxypeptidase regulatory-like domain-containing protein [Planctomycetota bacterium]